MMPNTKEYLNKMKTPVTRQEAENMVREIRYAILILSKHMDAETGARADSCMIKALEALGV